MIDSGRQQTDPSGPDLFRHRGERTRLHHLAALPDRGSPTSHGRSSCCPISRPCSRRPGGPRSLLPDRTGGVADGGGQCISPTPNQKICARQPMGPAQLSAAPARRYAPICPVSHVAVRRHESGPRIGYEPLRWCAEWQATDADMRVGARTGGAAKYLAALRRSWPIIFRACSVKRALGAGQSGLADFARSALHGVTAGQGRGGWCGPSRAGAKPTA